MPDSSYFTGQGLRPIVPGQFNFTPGAVTAGAQETFVKTSQNAPDPMTHLMNYMLGLGALRVGDDTGSFVLNPGGGFEVSSPKGFSVTGDPSMRSANVTIPVKFGDNRGTIGLEGSWGFDPSIQAKFKFGSKNPSLSNPEQVVDQAVAPYQQPYDPGTYAGGVTTARDLLNQTIAEYRSSGGRDPNSPTSWSR
jgi:hypothetical protein